MREYRSRANGPSQIPWSLATLKVEGTVYLRGRHAAVGAYHLDYCGSAAPRRALVFKQGGTVSAHYYVPMGLGEPAKSASKERGWDASKAVCSQLRNNLSMEALSMATTMAWGSHNDACCPAAA